MCCPACPPCPRNDPTLRACDASRRSVTSSGVTDSRSVTRSGREMTRCWIAAAAAQPRRGRPPPLCRRSHDHASSSSFSDSSDDVLSYKFGSRDRQPARRSAASPEPWFKIAQYEARLEARLCAIPVKNALMLTRVFFL
ncbi:hypothetical protein MA16_Dca018240 [Dendrobium catenatum]|uniref:Uncharacterized protein n=1 Tax=Dendrobium catenatum TaxID=906689 RepID=A0A2I0WZW4_9ASPA|nr:hypothetical protein MA16_Dca018240 [Dendrobium catenatum]